LARASLPPCMPDLLPHAFRYCILATTFVSALHSPTYPPEQTHALAEGPGPPSADEPRSATVWQAWVLPAVRAVQVSLLTPSGHSGSISQRIKEGNETGSGTVQVVLWACLAAIISTLFIFMVVMSWMYCGYTSSRAVGSSDSLKGLMGSRSESPGSQAHGSTERSKSLATSEQSGVSGDSGMLESPRTTATSIVQGQLPGLPLCPLLVVPDGTRLGCVVQNDVCRMKQELSFDVSAVPARGGAPLFRARVSELSAEGPAIYVETLGGRDQLAYLSTEDLWRNASLPVLGISRPWGLPYGTMQKGANGEYVVVRGQSPLLTFVGDYLSHSIQVMVPSGHTIATTLQTSPEEYQVHMQARTDAGLVILGLLAIDKCEIAARMAGAGGGG